MRIVTAEKIAAEYLASCVMDGTGTGTGTDQRGPFGIGKLYPTGEGIGTSRKRDYSPIGGAVDSALHVGTRRTRRAGPNSAAPGARRMGRS